MIPNYEKAMKSFSKRSKVKKEVEKKDTHVPPKNQREKDENNPINKFHYKYKYFEKYVDKYTSVDLVYFFREVALDNGYKYHITNLKKDARTMKLLKEDYSNYEICLMIEFLYESDQDYLDKGSLNVSILNSNWINTIYSNAISWVEDRYTPKSKQSNSTNQQKDRGEWKSSKEDDHVEIM